MERDLLTAPEAAARIGLNYRTFVRRAERGDITAAVVLPGLRKRRLYRAADVETMRAARQAELQAELAGLDTAS